MKSVDKTPNLILREWLDLSTLSAAECNRTLGYKSNYITLLVMNKNPRPITFDVIGRLLFHYGPTGPALEMAKALKSQRNGHTNGNGNKA
jgi:plasmid maintenance system antidote protein VapI